MGVFSDTKNDSVSGNEDGQDACEGGLHNDKDNTRHSLGSLRKTKLLNKDQHTSNGQYTDHLDADIDPLARLCNIWPVP